MTFGLNSPQSTHLEAGDLPHFSVSSGGESQLPRAGEGCDIAPLLAPSPAPARSWHPLPAAPRDPEGHSIPRLLLGKPSLEVVKEITGVGSSSVR